jgi:hypothetical protein
MCGGLCVCVVCEGGGSCKFLTVVFVRDKLKRRVYHEAVFGRVRLECLFTQRLHLLNTSTNRQIAMRKIG